MMGKTVLYVEDNEDNVYMLGRRLKRLKIDMDVAVTGEEGVDKALHNTYDLIIMDLSLPGIDGWEATQQIRAAGIETPVLALSAHAMQEHIDQALAAGANDFDSKPVDFERFKAKMEALLGEL
ncbi:response regulator [Maribrevibacterium harenarium]|uniref:Response regulator n=1 Tax=Maribrevibacterium harenarium TaxID=2589817 RepID=A0A501X2H9_9GAMM|nr:response regulator [Maribrevibacterium harenarium]TPE54689.1 response regulator [Maribrevibacterium harenarium]